MIGVPHHFFLNPNKLVFIARKPTEVDPRTYEADSLSVSNQQVGSYQQENRHPLAELRCYVCPRLDINTADPSVFVFPW